MKEKFNEYYNQIKHNRLFKTTMRSYFIIACIVFLAYALVMVLNIYHAAITQLTAAEQKMLTQAETTSDFILRNINSTANSILEEESTALDAMSKPYDPQLSYNTSALVSKMKLTSNAIDNVYFFNFKDDNIYTAENPVYSSKDFPDKELLELIYGSRIYTINYPHVLKYEDNYDIKEKRTLVSLYKYSDTSCMAVFVDSDKFNSMVNADFESGAQEMSIINAEGTVISSTDHGLFGKSMADDGIVKSIQSSQKKSGYKNNFGIIHCFRQSDSLNSLYICSFRSSSLIVSYIWQIVLIIIFAMLLGIFYLISSIRLSMSIFRPFRELRQDVFDILGLELNDEKDEVGTKQDLDKIAENLSKIKAEYDSLQENEHLYMETKLNELVYNIAIGAYNYDKRELDEYNIRFPYNYNTVALIRLDNTKNIERSNVGLILYGIANAGIELLTDSSTRAYATTYSNDYDIIFLINHEKPVFESNKLSVIGKYASHAFGITVSAAYDTDNSSLDLVPQLYTNVNTAMQYRLIRGHGSIISYKGLSDGLTDKCGYPSKSEKAVLREINAKNQEGAASAVDDFIQAISDMPYGYIITHSSVLMLTIAASIGSDKQDGVNDVISNTLSKIETVGELRDILVSKCNDAIISTSDIEINDKHVMVANLIEEYIDAHYTDPSLSIGMISSYVNKSDNYTRSIFKKNKGISISDYIAKKRYDEVCRILVETNLTAQVAAQRAGLNPGSYFYTAFKKYTGLTPDQYRKKHMGQ